MGYKQELDSEIDTAPETESLPKKERDLGFWESYKYYLLVLFAFVSFMFAYMAGFLDSNIGLFFLGLSIIFIAWFVIELFMGKRSKFSIKAERCQDVSYYYRWLNNYMATTKHPRYPFQFTSTGKFSFYPEIQPSLLFMEQYDKISKESYIVTLRITPVPSIRSIDKGTWVEFQRTKFLRLRMLGFLPKMSGETVTYVTKEGKKVSVPLEYSQLFDIGGGLF